MAEASLLSGVDIVDRKSGTEAAKALVDLGPAVVITGLLEERWAVDIVAYGDDLEALEHKHVDTPNVLGTGCSLSAAITASLATGLPFDGSVYSAASFVLAGLESATTWRLGAGRGPIDHFADPQPR